MESSTKRLPPWLVRKTKKGGAVHNTKAGLRGHTLHTVCEQARCPNIGECFSKPTATYLILGNSCTRRCGFCAVEKGAPVPVDLREPDQIAAHAHALGLTHVVITSVTRDDLPDGGAGHFVACAKAVKQKLPDATVEVLIPDFAGNKDAIRAVADAPIDVFNHNTETVPRLYSQVRPLADYRRSLELLSFAKSLRPGLITKSGLMVGLGETLDEVRGVFADLAKNEVDAITVGQYMRPSRKHLPVVEYLLPEVFKQLAVDAKAAGIRHAFCAPLVRSSYNASALLGKIKSEDGG